MKSGVRQSFILRGATEGGVRDDGGFARGLEQRHRPALRHPPHAATDPRRIELFTIVCFFHEHPVKVARHDYYALRRLNRN